MPVTGRKDLARTSKTPGRTQLLNFFELAGGARLVDLPGYGYAKVPEAMKRSWRELLTRYVETRESLKGLVIVMDARHPLTDFDRQMLGWSGEHDLRAHLLLTKADKLSRGAALATLKQVRAETDGAASAQLFSAVDEERRGRGATRSVEHARRNARAICQIKTRPKRLGQKRTPMTT